MKTKKEIFRHTYSSEHEYSIQNTRQREMSKDMFNEVISSDSGQHKSA